MRRGASSKSRPLALPTSSMCPSRSRSPTTRLAVHYFGAVAMPHPHHSVASLYHSGAFHTGNRLPAIYRVLRLKARFHLYIYCQTKGYMITCIFFNPPAKNVEASMGHRAA